MADDVNAEVITIGTEILLGELTDTNSVYLAQQLRDLGINLYLITSVGDNRQRIADAIRLAFTRADVVITCGGLGPTVDDMTRQSVADATDRQLEFHQELYDQIAARFASFNVTMTANNNRQAYLPEHAITIENPVGTAPAFIVEHGIKSVISLPGVPREMKFLFETRIVDYLRSRYQLGIIKKRVLKTAGIGESSLDDLLGDELLNSSNPSLGLAAHHGIIDIRMTAKADDATTADTMLDGFEARVKDRVDHYIFGSEQDELEDVLSTLVTEHHLSIALAEYGVSGAVHAKLEQTNHTDILSEVIRAAHPSETATVFPQTAGMSLRDSAHHIATVIAERNAASAGIVILSLPEIDEDRDSNIATVVAVSVAGTVKSRVYGFGGKHPLTGDWVSRWAMAYVWRELKAMLHV